MGYDIHITRANHWSSNSGSQISSAEWMDLLHRDPDLIVDPENGEFAARWNSPSEPEGWLDWFDGNIFTTNPSQPVVAKMLQLARELNAKVQGDNGEWYETAEQWQGEEVT